jgi:glutamate racemase
LINPWENWHKRGRLRYRRRAQGEKHNQMFCTAHFPEESQFKKALNLWGFESLDVIKID